MKDKKKSLQSVLCHEPAARQPIWLMRQAGRYLPEYRALREKAGSFMKLCFNPELASAVTLQPVTRFGMDGTILFSDILVVPYGLGLQLEFVEGEGPKLERVSGTLPVFDEEQFFERTKNIYETLKITRAALPDFSTLIGFAGSPFTVACYMLGGRGHDEFVTARKAAYENPAFFEALLARVVDATIFYLKEQVKAGAEVIQLFDSWSNLVPASYYRNWVITPTQTIVRALHKAFPDLPIIGFPRGSGMHIAAYVKETGVNAVSLDQTVDVTQLHETVDPKIIFQGNLDPLLMRASRDVMVREAAKVFDAMKQPFIFNLGHGLTPDVPPDNVAALVEFVHTR